MFEKNKGVLYFVMQKLTVQNLPKFNFLNFPIANNTKKLK